MSSSCLTCRKPNAKSRCSRCKCTFYCNVTCQRKDWPKHKKICKSLVKKEINTKEQLINKYFGPRTRTIATTQQLFHEISQEVAEMKKYPRVLSGKYAVIVKKDTINEDSCDVSKCKRLSRLCQVLTAYHHFLSTQSRKKADVHSILQNECDVTTIINDFHHLVEVHDVAMEDIYDILVAKSNISPICSLQTCAIFHRNYRDRTQVTTNDVVLEKLYFDCTVNGVVIQQVLDKIHNHYFHSYDIGYRISRNDRLRIQKMIDTDDTKETDVYDKTTAALSELIRLKQKLYQDIEPLVLLKDKAAKFTIDTGPDNEIRYSMGFKFFYWDFYKNCTYIEDPAGNPYPQTFANDDYPLKEFFVSAKYNCLKNEITENDICTISKKQWDILIRKAESHCNADHFKQMKADSTKIDTQKYYNIAEGATITAVHVASMMLYCNNDYLQRRFSETFRKISSNESNQSLIQRHRHFAHLSRLLREFVECFCATNNLEHIRNLYHGMTIKTQFQSMNSCIKGAMSATTELSVAVSFSEQTGIILKFDTALFCRHQFYDCAHLSDYSNEAEVFFIGGHNQFLFQSIIRPTGEDYQYYVQALSTLSDTCEPGAYLLDIEDYGPRVRYMFWRILLHKLHEYYPENENYKTLRMTSYASGLVNRHLNSIETIWFSMDALDPDGPMMTAFRRFSKKVFRCLFYFCDGWINLYLLTSLFPSLTSIRFDTQRRNDTFCEYYPVYDYVLWFIEKHRKLSWIQIAIPNKDYVIQKANQMVSLYRKAFWRKSWYITTTWDDDDNIPQALILMTSKDNLDAATKEKAARLALK